MLFHAALCRGGGECCLENLEKPVRVDQGISCGMGLVLGSLSLRTREAWEITSMISILLYILSGVNFPINVLPKFLQAISYSLPLTRGIQAARLAMNGADWSTISPLFIGELLIGLIYIVAGYMLFIWFEKLSLVDGQIEAM